jgi:hypothetical protein
MNGVEEGLVVDGCGRDLVGPKQMERGSCC